MSNQARKQASTAEEWENGKLGSEEEFARKAPIELEQAVDNALDLQPISIRLQKQLLEQLKFIAVYRGIGYQPLVRDLLNRFVRAELIDIAHELKKTAEAKTQISGVGAGDDGPAAQFVAKERKRA
jgi:predicted DNA binding CopG/RHH family protein